MRLVSERRAERRHPRVVIVGAGFGGLTVAKNLAKTPVDVTLIDREKHHLFQPLLYQVATAGLSPADIVYKRLRIKGRLAWWIWGVAHIYFLISLRNRLLVTTQWLWSYVTFERGVRLITGTRAPPESDQTDTRTKNAPSPDGQEAA